MANKNYPHPVLCIDTDDYTQSDAAFDIKIIKKTDRMNYKLICDVSLHESNLEALLAEGKVTFLIKVTCSATRYREVFQFDRLDYIITIPSSIVEKKVEISTFIIAIQGIDAYFSEAFHEDYDDTTFVIFPGDVLAEGSNYSFNADKKVDPLVKVPSIFTIIINNNIQAPPFDVSRSNEKIIVALNKDNFHKYKYLKELQNQYGQLAALTSSIFILPALVEVINNIRKDLSEYNDDYDSIAEYIANQEIENRWFKVLNMKLQDADILLSKPDDIIESSLLIAQKLLGDPVSNGLNFFDELLSGEEEGVI
ncbi:hypothetical protein RMT88_17665 [Bacillus altitudinis]|uniref:hypothetical protein n=1 Tax=Bacillus altitudinis TaxID=293387 RepID=UPI000C15F70D|nr:hypothetical protein [Bacillus altitudinis]ATP92627.1 hypothetical protein CSE15_00945 [Bacillus altitudinis]MCY7715957.1 hypothetical protein [Bacillus altitudinis]MDT1121853.1 hypothetical protein [Bacillus altitudinis]